MGGRPVTAMNIVCYPAIKGEHETLQEILLGALEACNEADCVVAGGHTVDDEVVKFGLSVTGLVHPEKFWANGGAKDGDALVLTKALGTGIVVTALLAEMDEGEDAQLAFQSMKRLNRQACEIASHGFTVNGATDITGFGLLGHCVEMAQSSFAQLRINTAEVPVLSGATEYASMGLVPAGAYRNREAFECRCLGLADLEKERVDILNDPQTSGGLLLSLPAEQADDLVTALQEGGVHEAKRIGEVIAADGKAQVILNP